MEKCIMPPEVVLIPAENALAAASVSEEDTRPIWEIAAELGEQIPAEERARVPHDGSKNYKHHLYGARKVE